MKRRTKIVSVLLTACISFGMLFGFSACSNDEDTRAVALMMEEAVEKIEEVNEMVAWAEIAQEAVSPTSAYAKKSSVSFASQTTLPGDMSFRTMDTMETITRQIQVKYPYVIVDYLLQSAVKGNNHKKKFEVDEVFYGPARKVIDGKLTELFEDPSIPDPILAIEVQKEEHGFSFKADWDWRNDYLAQNYPRYNTVIMSNGKVEYFQNEKKIKRILMNWCWEYNGGDIMSSIIDFEKNEFYYWEAFHHYAPPSKTIGATFNDGEFTFEKLVEYRYEGAHVVKSNISENPEELDFQAYAYYDSDIENVENYTYKPGEKYDKFRELYDEVYAKVRQAGLQFRDKTSRLSTKGGTEIDYMDYATRYGLHRTEIATTVDKVHFLYITEKDLRQVLHHLSKEDRVKNNPEIASLIFGASNSLDNLNGPYVGELGSYNGKQYRIEYNYLGGYEYAYFNHRCMEFNYSITDGDNAISFVLDKKKPVLKEIASYKGLAFNLLHDSGEFNVYCADKSVEEITIPATYNGYEIQAVYGFSDCPNLKKATILGGKEIYSEAFYNCPNLETVIIGESVQIIYGGAFSGCENLIEVINNSPYFTVEKGVSSNGGVGRNAVKVVNPGDENNPLEKTEKNGFKIVSYGEETVLFKYQGKDKFVRVPDGVTSIHSHAFGENNTMLSITLPESLVGLPYDAFENCHKLIEVVDKSSTVPVFYNNQVGGRYVLSTSAGADEESKIEQTDDMLMLDGWLVACQQKKELIIPDYIDKQWGEVFDGFTETTYVKAKARLFYGGCFPNVEKVVVTGGDGLNGAAFENCQKLREVELAEGIQVIGWNAFKNCVSLEEIVLPKGLNRIENDAFEGCTSLKKIEIASVKEIGWNAFKNCVGLEEIVLPNDLEELGGDAFASCTSLKKVTINGNINWHIREKFSGCDNLETIIIGDGVEEIGDLAFESCYFLKKIVIPNSVKRIQYGAFTRCNNLEEVVLSKNVEEIDRDTFVNCRSLKRIVVASNVEDFDNLSMDTHEYDGVYFQGTEEQWRDISWWKDILLEVLPTLYLYSEEEPKTEGNYWRVEDGEIVVW